MTQQFPPLTPRIILGIAAHPDDLDVCAAGTLAHFAEQGAAVHYLILTDGSKGSDDPSLTSKDLIAIRRREQQAALECIGGTSVQFLDYPDGELEITMTLKRDIVKAIRHIKPDVVITMDPSLIYAAELGIINHPDHRAAGQATLDAVFPLARDRLAFPELAEEGYAPHKVATILLSNFTTSNFAVDISRTFDKKIAAMRTHVSQFGDTAVFPWLEKMAIEQGKLYGHDKAEGFVRINIA